MTQIVNKRKSSVKKRGENPVVPKLKWAGSKVQDDIFSDDVSLFKSHFDIDYENYLQRLWDANKDIHQILVESEDLELARDRFYAYLDQTERKIFDLDNNLHILEKSTVRECIRVLRSIIGPINEFRTEFSALDSMWKLAQNKRTELKEKISVGFILEFINLFRGVTGKSYIYLEDKEVRKGIPDFLRMKGREAAHLRTEMLDAQRPDSHRTQTWPSRR